MASNEQVLRVSRTVILAKIEVTEGTDPVPTGADNAIQVQEATVGPAGTVLDRNPIKGTLGPLAPVQGQLWFEFSIVVEGKSNGNADAGNVANKIEFDTLMQISGLKPEYSVGNWIKYRPVSTPSDMKTATLYVFFDGVRHVLRACRANCEYSVEAGNWGTYTFTGMGLWQKPSDVALPSTPNIYQTSPPVLESACVDLGSPSVFNPVIQSFSVNMNNEIGTRTDPCSSYAVKGFVLGNRDTQGAYNPEATLLADHDWWADYVQKTQRLLEVQVGTTTGQINEVSVPRSVIREMPYGERETWRSFEITYTAVEGSTGDDEVEYIFR